MPLFKYIPDYSPRVPEMLVPRDQRRNSAIPFNRPSYADQFGGGQERGPARTGQDYEIVRDVAKPDQQYESVNASGSRPFRSQQEGYLWRKKHGVLGSQDPYEPALVNSDIEKGHASRMQQIRDRRGITPTPVAWPEPGSGSMQGRLTKPVQIQHDMTLPDSGHSQSVNVNDGISMLYQGPPSGGMAPRIPIGMAESNVLAMGVPGSVTDPQITAELQRRDAMDGGISMLYQQMTPEERAIIDQRRAIEQAKVDNYSGVVDQYLDQNENVRRLRTGVAGGTPYGRGPNMVPGQTPFAAPLSGTGGQMSDYLGPVLAQQMGVSRPQDNMVAGAMAADARRRELVNDPTNLRSRFGNYIPSNPATRTDGTVMITGADGTGRYMTVHNGVYNPNTGQVEGTVANPVNNSMANFQRAEGGYSERVQRRANERLAAQGFETDEEQDKEMARRRRDYIARTKGNSEWNRRKKRRGGLDYVPTRSGPVMPGDGRVDSAADTENRYTPANKLPVPVTEEDNPQSVSNKQKDAWSRGVFDDYVAATDKSEVLDKLRNSSVDELKMLRDRYDKTSDQFWSAVQWTNAEIESRSDFVDDIDAIIAEKTGDNKKVKLKPIQNDKGRPVKKNSGGVDGATTGEDGRRVAPPSLPYQPDPYENSAIPPVMMGPPAMI